MTPYILGMIAPQHAPPQQTPDRQAIDLASMSSFIDFALAAGTSKMTVVADHKRNRDSPVTDFYRPIREAIAAIHRHKLDAHGVFENVLMHTGDERAKRIFPSIIAGHATFLKAFSALPWIEPTTAALPAGTGLGIAINPEVGFILNGYPHHLKLYLRREPLSQRRVDFTVAAMAVALPVRRDERLAVLDLRNGRVCYLSEKAAAAKAWGRLSGLVNVEAAAFAEAWGRV